MCGRKGTPCRLRPDFEAAQRLMCDQTTCVRFMCVCLARNACSTEHVGKPEHRRKFKRRRTCVPDGHLYVASM